MEQDAKDALERLYNHAKIFVHEYERNKAALDGQLTSATHAAITAMIDESEFILTEDDKAVAESELVDKIA
jgi:hypothetical protein